ncbi:hypothetical protein IMG5_174960 [Ichthyophthirius multifiliis]|uniref:Aminotransferase class V domain-containing protein n=1 Tax=Ichthyophthirius multifiliis TaxID=5932 RepID=G0R250_ICHMU|nr:hypothetical protein IMG5_174960 [Ichthyophthirius multifiliis]EGR28457.1 hypothetical protein IMG5_174960 [Ichthyophthirius multifiliis]|eukprot:XP_004029693.1 hypothetical protein IMG5_174960 [Ichthyophthirius multifiliis]
MITLFSKVVKNIHKKSFLIPKTQFSSLKQPLLFTPGPLLTSNNVKLSMNYDYGSRDPRFMQIIKDIRNDILKICEVQKGEYECILLQGSGTYAVEAVLGQSIPKGKHKLLIVQNGAYGIRMEKISLYYGLNYTTLNYSDCDVVKPKDVAQKLQENPDITHVSIIHSETTSGLINPIEEIGKVIKNFNKNIVYIVDSMSSFAAYRINPKEIGIDYLVASSNKNLQGIPGFAFVIANNKHFQNTKDNARSMVLDLYQQWQGLEDNGQFRFTPPTHVLKATKVAIDEYFEQGGQPKRFQKYDSNQKLLTKRMTEMGFKLYIEPKYQGCIITTFLNPKDPNFKFNEFYQFLADKNMVIYPGKLTKADSFRIGSIGEINNQNISQLCEYIHDYLVVKKCSIPVKYD